VEALRSTVLSSDSVFEALERSAMKPLPATLYEYAEWKLASVNFD
jgi:hypothetical protein